MSHSIIDKNQSAGQLTGMSDCFVRVQNPSTVYPPYEIHPIAPPLTSFTKPPVAVLMDMDGTTTTTETLCLHSLEHAVRSAMGPAGANWKGLDPESDYPNVIGNSTTRHMEYLVDAYGQHFDADALGRAFLTAADWTLRHGRDQRRKQQVEINLRLAGKRPDSEFENEGLRTENLDLISENPDLRIEKLDSRTGHPDLRIENPDLIIAACIDIYYQRYHEILAAIERDDRSFLQQIPGMDARRSFIEPMPAVALTLALLKGDLGSEAELIALPENSLNDSDLSGSSLSDSPHPDKKTTLRKLGLFFRDHPVKLALVTSSIRYEADIVLQEVFRSIRKETESWPVSDAVKTKLKERFRHPMHCYDSIVTADDSSEIRLKPHRDLYSIALQQLGIPPDQFDRAIGFEDSDSGTIAIRAAGIGRCIALPFHETSGHAFHAASAVARGGLPEVLIQHRFFLDKLIP